MAITGDTRKLRELQKRMATLRDPRFRSAVSRTLAEEAIRQVGESFRHGRDPYGKPWKESYRARTEGGQTLRDRAQLQRSISYSDVTDQGFRIGTNVVYARIHNLGGVIRAKTAKGLRFALGRRTNRKNQRRKWVTVDQVTLPRRTFIPTAQTGGIGPIWSKAFREAANSAIRKLFNRQ